MIENTMIIRSICLGLSDTNRYMHIMFPLSYENQVMVSFGKPTKNFWHFNKTKQNEYKATQSCDLANIYTQEICNDQQIVNIFSAQWK